MSPVEILNAVQVHKDGNRLILTAEQCRAIVNTGLVTPANPLNAAENTPGMPACRFPAAATINDSETDPSDEWLRRLWAENGGTFRLSAIVGNGEIGAMPTDKLLPFLRHLVSENAKLKSGEMAADAEIERLKAEAEEAREMARDARRVRDNVQADLDKVRDRVDVLAKERDAAMAEADAAKYGGKTAAEWFMVAQQRQKEEDATRKNHIELQNYIRTVNEDITGEEDASSVRDLIGHMRGIITSERRLRIRAEKEKREAEANSAVFEGHTAKEWNATATALETQRDEIRAERDAAVERATTATEQASSDMNVAITERDEAKDKMAKAEARAECLRQIIQRTLYVFDGNEKSKECTDYLRAEMDANAKGVLIFSATINDEPKSSGFTDYHVAYTLMMEARTFVEYIRNGAGVRPNACDVDKATFLLKRIDAQPVPAMPEKAVTK